MKNKWIVATLLPAAAAYGQSSVSSEPDMIVTASRMLQSSDQVLVPYTVITAAQIETMQAKSIADVLAMQPGVDIRSNGGRGQATSISIRGE
ncbi:MAG: Vitamin B12 transporter BtuB [Candidatus Celerinatantimonas neptuna]|nr:MAG: Vitamin B12 transporter BtuB [Candidatus Celerinatantimonas neptuna]